MRFSTSVILAATAVAAIAPQVLAFSEEDFFRREEMKELLARYPKHGKGRHHKGQQAEAPPSDDSQGGTGLSKRSPHGHGGGGGGGGGHHRQQQQVDPSAGLEARELEEDFFRREEMKELLARYPKHGKGRHHKGQQAEAPPSDDGQGRTADAAGLSKRSPHGHGGGGGGGGGHHRQQQQADPAGLEAREDMIELLTRSPQRGKGRAVLEAREDLFTRSPQRGKGRAGLEAREDLVELLTRSPQHGKGRAVLGARELMTILARMVDLD